MCTMRFSTPEVAGTHLDALNVMRMAKPNIWLAIGTACFSAGCATLRGHGPTTREAAEVRTSILATSQVWRPISTRSLDLKAGPAGRDALPFQSVVSCTYVEQKLGGKSPKFLCKINDHDTVKVKYGATNGEVLGEVLATRLLWALGFGADRMYPVTVVCRGCPDTLGGIEDHGNARRFDPAVIERPMAGDEWPSSGATGWAWNELNVVNPRAGGATLAQRDALKLLAVFVQHTDSKAEQQRILCLGNRRRASTDTCTAPFLMISDVGLTFGRANAANVNETGSVNFSAWRQTRIWKHDTGCVGNLPKSLTGTLDDPVISEEGRRFLANRLGQLSDRQLRDLFEAARVELRPRSPGDPSTGHATVGEWVDVFKAKRREIAERRCGDTTPDVTARAH